MGIQTSGTGSALSNAGTAAMTVGTGTIAVSSYGSAFIALSWASEGSICGTSNQSKHKTMAESVSLLERYAYSEVSNVP